jgi:AraC-like DNA-binding protein
LKEYCITCHSTEKQKGDLDLEVFSSLDAVKKHPKIWQSVAEQLANKEMPPKKEPQLTPDAMHHLTSWVSATLDDIARARAGDPGPVVLRRLSNAEYTYTVRDLTEIDSLDPAREFPVDGAAGEGFTNTGQALVMSPSLITKYLDAAKDIASHAVLLPTGIRFSPTKTRRDWTEEIVREIRQVYHRYTDTQAGEKTVQQGVTMDRSNEAGRLPLARYIVAAVEERDLIASGQKSVEAAAQNRGLSPKYLATLFAALSSEEPSLLLDPIRARWREAKLGDAPSLVAEIEQWQRALWKFSSVGHIGKVGGPKAWMERVSPLTARQEIRYKLPASDGKDVTIYLVATDAGDGNANDFVMWEQPRLVAPGRPDLLLRDVRAVSTDLAQRRQQVFASAASCLDAAAEATIAAVSKPDVAALAQKHGVDAKVLRAWLNFLGIGSEASAKIDSHFTAKTTSGGTYEFIRGWGTGETPNLLANSSDQHVRIPGNMKPHSVAVHPSPKLRAAVGWRSPAAATLRIEASVQHAHPECGNGVTWSLELRRGSTRPALSAGIAQGAAEVKVPAIEALAVQPGDLISLLIGPRDGNHSCDLTAVDLVLTSTGGEQRTWNLAADVSSDVLAGNPHADGFGNEGVWHFYTEPDGGGSGPESVIPTGSVLARWLTTASPDEKRQIAAEVQRLLLEGPAGGKDTPDAKLWQQLTAFGGPLLPATARQSTPPTADPNNSGPDPGLFGRHPDGQPIDAASLCVQAPSIVEFHIPAELAAGCEFVTTGKLEKRTGSEGSVQLQVLNARPRSLTGLVASTASVAVKDGTWTANNQTVSVNTPIVVNDGTAARERFEPSWKTSVNFSPRHSATRKSSLWTKWLPSPFTIAKTST